MTDVAHAAHKRNTLKTRHSKPCTSLAEKSVTTFSSILAGRMCLLVELGLGVAPVVLARELYVEVGRPEIGLRGHKHSMLSSHFRLQS